MHTIGQEALDEHNAALVGLANVVRGGPEVVMFALGLLLIGAGAILVAIPIWRSGSLPDCSGIPFAVAFALYIPQFFGTQPLRVAHGLLVLAGCLWIALDMWRAHSKQVTQSQPSWSGGASSAHYHRVRTGGTQWIPSRTAIV